MAIKYPGITRRAAAAIAALMEHCEKELGKGHLPVVDWMSDSTDVGFVPGPCIAVDLREKIPADDILHAHGVDFAFGLTDARCAEFENSSLDFFGGTFLFVDNTMARFLGD